MIIRSSKRERKISTGDAVVSAIKDGASVKDIAIKYPLFFLRHSRGIPALVAYQLPVDLTRNVCVILLLGPTGTGKSHWARQYSIWHNKSMYSKTPQKSEDVMWFDGYMSQEILLLDDFNVGQMEYRFLLHVLDVYAMQVQTKGGMVQALWDTVIITSNSKPSEWYQFTDLGPLHRRIVYVRDCNTPYAVGYVDFKKEFKGPEPIVFERKPVLLDSDLDYSEYTDDMLTAEEMVFAGVGYEQAQDQWENIPDFRI